MTTQRNVLSSVGIILFVVLLAGRSTVSCSAIADNGIIGQTSTIVTTQTTTSTTSTTTTATTTTTSTSSQTTTSTTTQTSTSTTSTTTTSTTTSTSTSTTITITTSTIVGTYTSYYFTASIPITIYVYITSSSSTSTITTLTSTSVSTTITTTTATTTLTTTSTTSPRRCVIASAAYGSDLAPTVQFLREYRDEKLRSTFAGKEFIRVFDSFYYSFSPVVASVIDQNLVLSDIFRLLINPLISALQISSNLFHMVSFAPEIATVVSGVFATALVGIMYVTPLCLIAGLARKSRETLKRSNKNR